MKKEYLLVLEGKKKSDHRVYGIVNPVFGFGGHNVSVLTEEQRTLHEDVDNVQYGFLVAIVRHAAPVEIRRKVHMLYTHCIGAR